MTGIVTAKRKNGKWHNAVHKSHPSPELMGLMGRMGHMGLMGIRPIGAGHELIARLIERCMGNRIDAG